MLSVRLHTRARLRQGWNSDLSVLVTVGNIQLQLPFLATYEYCVTCLEKAIATDCFCKDSNIDCECCEYCTLVTRNKSGPWAIRKKYFMAGKQVTYLFPALYHHPKRKELGRMTCLEERQVLIVRAECVCDFATR